MQGPVVLASHRRPFGLCENGTYINAPHSGTMLKYTAVPITNIYKWHQFSKNVSLPAARHYQSNVEMVKKKTLFPKKCYLGDIAKM